MTALLALEQRAAPRALRGAAATTRSPVESKIDLRAGERMSVDDLLEALLLESANDAAVTLAEGVSGSREAFVADMNERRGRARARRHELRQPDRARRPAQLLDGRATSPTLAALLLRKPRFARIVDMPSAVLATGARRRVVDNRNTLVVEHPFVDGVKTGHTAQAGYVLVGSAQRAGRAGDQRGAGRADRGRARRRHARAAALRARPVPAPPRARRGPRRGQCRDRAPRRARAARARAAA